ncbi:hypothetical protein CDAR_410851 [Caerostris darwini]|uniref:Uncharacterized protein n=1 Tax=Caerostris darwini TaxID=1538125 RepID=A0AAV4SF43_9ARAC|nr:hypothetical protein CDAR_410851 [Caerostris darwini]
MGVAFSGMGPPPASDVTGRAAQWTRRPVRARPPSGVQGSVPVLASGERRRGFRTHDTRIADFADASQHLQHPTDVQVSTPSTPYF